MSKNQPIAADDLPALVRCTSSSADFVQNTHRTRPFSEIGANVTVAKVITMLYMALPDNIVLTKHKQDDNKCNKKEMEQI